MELLTTSGNFAKGAMFIILGLIAFFYAWYRWRNDGQSSGAIMLALGGGILFFSSGLHRFMWFFAMALHIDADMVTATIWPYLVTPVQLIGMILILSGGLKELWGRFWIPLSVGAVVGLQLLGVVIVNYI